MFKLFLGLFLFVFIGTSCAAQSETEVARLDTGEIVHCYVPDNGAYIKIIFPEPCPENLTNYQCSKKVEVFGKAFNSKRIIERFEVTEIYTFENSSGVSRYGELLNLSEDEIYIIFKRPNESTDNKFYIDLQMENVPWVNDLLEDGAEMKFEIPDGDVFRAHCGIYHPGKYGDRYERW